MADGFKFIDNTTDNQPVLPGLTPEESQKARRNPATGPKGINLAAILDYYAKGLKPTEIARLLNCNHANIHRRLARAAAELSEAKDYREHRADYFSVLQLRALKQVTSSALKKQSAAQNATIAAILYDKERLERGQSTSNIAYADLSANEQALDARLAELDRELGLAPQDAAQDDTDSEADYAEIPQDTV